MSVCVPLRLAITRKLQTGDAAPFRLIGDDVPGARFGSAIAGIGDINGDGLKGKCKVYVSVFHK